jgi:hypothetical protein
MMILDLHRQWLSPTAIARQLGIDRKTHGGTGSQVIADPRDNPFPDCPLTPPEWATSSERWATSDRNGERYQIRTPGGFRSE